MESESTREPSSWQRARQLLGDGSNPKLEELFDLIHEINPTGNTLSADARDMSYEIKAGLQSLLIERFGEQIQVEEVPGTDGSTVGLRHRFGHRDACHALTRALSPRARSWVRWQQDLAEDAGLSTEPPKEGVQRRKRQSSKPGRTTTSSEPLSLIEKGEAALSEFDFESAREHLQAALQLPETLANANTTLRATRALVLLLGDHLAAYEELLDLRRDLHPAAESDAEIRCLLALAAAKSRRVKLATQLLQNLDLDRVNEVRIELAHQALEAEDVQACQAWLAQVSEHSSFAAHALSLSQSLSELRTRLATPLEAELEDIQDQADQESLLQLAHQILDLHPGSRPARRTLARIREDRERAQTTQILDRIGAFLDQGDAENAGLLLHQLDPDAKGYAELHKRHSMLCELATQESERSATEALCSALGAEPTAAWVESFWKATAPVRSAVLAGIDRPWLTWLEEFGPAIGHSRCQATAAALRSLPLAEQHWEQQQGQKTEDLLSPHQDILSSSKRGRAWLAEVRDAAREERHQERLQAEREREAAELAERRAQEAAEHEQKEFLQSRWMETVIKGPDGANLLDEIPVQGLCENVTTPLQADRNRLIHVEALGNRIHIHVFALDAQEEPHLVLHAPAPFRLLSSQVLGNRLWLLGEQSLLEIDLDRLAILNEISLADLELDRETWLDQASRRKGKTRQNSKSKKKKPVWAPMTAGSMPSKGELDSAFIAPGACHVWLGQGNPQSLGVADLDGLNHLRFFQYRYLVWPIWGSIPPLLVMSTDGVQCQGFDADGHMRWEHRSSGIVSQVLPHPAKDALIVLTSPPQNLHDADCENVLVAEERSLTGEHIATLDLGPIDFEQPIRAVTAKDEARIYVAASLMDRGPVLMAIEAQTEGLSLLWQRSLSGELALFQDSESRRALAFYREGKVARLLPPDQVPARRPLSFPGSQLHLPCFEDLDGCNFDDSETQTQITAFEAVLPLIRRAELGPRIRAWLECDPNLAALLGLYSCEIPARSKQAILSRLQEQFGDQPRACLLTALPLLQAGEPAKALALLDGFSASRFPLPQQQHLAHLHALCLFALGNYDLAHRTLRKAARLRCKTCDLGPLRLLVDTLRTPPRKLARAMRDPCLQGLLSRLLAYDFTLSKANISQARIAKEDLDHAKNHLSDPLVPRSGQLQAIARLAELQLCYEATPAHSSRTWRSKRILGRYLEAWSRSPEIQGIHDFPLLGKSTWAPDRLHELATRVSQALDEPLPTPRSPMDELGPADLSPLVAGASFTTLVERISGPTSRGQRIKDLQPLHRNELRLLSEAQDCRQRRLIRRMIGLVIDPDHPLAAPFRSARSLLISHKARGPEVSLPVTLEAAMDLLSPWPNLIQDFCDFHRESVDKHRNRLTLFLLTPQGAGFRQSRT